MNSTITLTHSKLSFSAEDPSIDMLRGLAACLVMASHYTHMLTPHPGLWGFASTGVDLFFVLSGYVFAPNLHGNPVSVFPHLIRRFFRLVPLYWFSLTLYILLRWVEEYPIPYVLEHLLLIHTLESIEIAATYNPAFWSLPPELEFYLTLPILAWAGARWHFGWLLTGSLILHMGLVMVSDTQAEKVNLLSIATIHLPGLLCEFMLGAWTWYCVRNAPALKARLARGGGGVLLLAFTMLVYSDYVADFGNGPVVTPLWVGGNMGLLAAFSYAWLLSACLGCSFFKKSMLLGRIWVLLGQCSYGIYLLHNAIPRYLVWTGLKLDGWWLATVSATVTLLVAWLLHRLLEQPLRQWGRTLASRW